MNNRIEGQKYPEEATDILCRITAHPSFTVTHYINGTYEQKSNEDKWSLKGQASDFEGITSVQMNRLKGRLFNLIEASHQDAESRNATKGLVKDFCNDCYSLLIKDLDNFVKRMGLKSEVDNPNLDDWPEAPIN